MRSREEKLEFKKELEVRTLDFSVRVFKLLNALPKNSAMRVISYQLGKSASSIGANYREANRAESGDDFAHKISIALTEASFLYGKLHGKGMNAARQILRRFGRAMGTRTRSAADYSITATISVVPDPLALLGRAQRGRVVNIFLFKGAGHMEAI